MENLWWILTATLMLIGLAGTVVPFLPGTAIIFAGAVIHHFTVRGPYTVGWGTLSVLAVLLAISFLLDMLSGTVGARWAGATWWGAFGGLVGTIVGLFFGLIGVFVGPLAGVLLGELIGGKKLAAAGKATWGTLLGTTAGIICQGLVGLLMVGWFLVAAFWR